MANPQQSQAEIYNLQISMGADPDVLEDLGYKPLLPEESDSSPAEHVFDPESGCLFDEAATVTEAVQAAAHKRRAARPRHRLTARQSRLAEGRGSEFNLM